MNHSEFFVDRAFLLNFLRSAQSILDKKTEKSSGKITFEVDHSNLSLIVDGSIYVESKTQCDSNTAIVFSTSCMLLYDLIRTFDASDQKIRFKVMQSNIEISYIDGEFNLGRFESAGKPMEPEGDFTSFRVKLSTIAEKLKLISGTIPEYNIREHFRGAHAILDSGKLVVWSCDGHRLSMHKFEVDSYDSFECIWPKRFIEYIYLNDSEEMAEFRIYQTHVKCVLKDRVFMSSLVNASVVKIDKILPQPDSFKYKIIVNSADFAKRIERVMVLNDDSGRVLIDFTENSEANIYSANAVDSNTAAKSREKISILKSHGELSKIYFNGVAILSFIRNLKGLIAIKYFSQNGDIVITQDGEEYPMYLTKELV